MWHNALCFAFQLGLLATGLSLAVALGESALMTFLVIQFFLANLLVLKQVVLFGFDITTCDAFTIAALVCINLLRVQYGPASAQRALKSAAIFAAMIALLLYCHTLWIPSVYDKMDSVYRTLFEPIIDVYVVSLLVFALVSCVDYMLFHTLTELKPRLNLGVRMVVSIMLSQALDTWLFTLFALGPWIHDFWVVCFWSYWVKVLTSFILVPMVLGCLRWFRLEKLSVDRDILYV